MHYTTDSSECSCRSIFLLVSSDSLRAIYLKESSAIIRDVTISGNNAAQSGGGHYCENSIPAITGNTITPSAGAAIQD
jgi:hypothetical protein